MLIYELKKNIFNHIWTLALLNINPKRRSIDHQEGGKIKNHFFNLDKLI